MSKERWLLNEWIGEYVTNGDLEKVYRETMALFAQPKPKQEPVAWLHEWVDELGETVRSIYSHFYEHQNLIPLYTSPPKREPLSNLAIKEAGRNAKDMSFYNGVKWAEQQHGIGVDDE